MLQNQSMRKMNTFMLLNLVQSCSLLRNIFRLIFHSDKPFAVRHGKLYTMPKGLSVFTYAFDSRSFMWYTLPVHALISVWCELAVNE